MNNHVITDKGSGLNLCARYIAAIDVGICGYVCLLDIDTFSAQFFPLPTTTYLVRTKNKDLDGLTIRRKKRRIDEKELQRLINKLATPMTLCFVLEHQAAFPNQGHVSTAKLLYQYGLLRGLIMQTGIRLEVVRPAVWKRRLGLVTPRTKDDQPKPPLTTYQKKCLAWERAIELFPQLREQLTPKSRSFDKAEALLLAYDEMQFRLGKYGVKKSA